MITWNVHGFEYFAFKLFKIWPQYRQCGRKEIMGQGGSEYACIKDELFSEKKSMPT